MTGFVLQQVLPEGCPGREDCDKLERVDAGPCCLAHCMVCWMEQQHEMSDS